VRRRSSESAALMDVLIGRTERVLFRFNDEVRAGFPERGVESGQHMIGHVGSIGLLCDWALVEMRLDLDRSTVIQLCRYHDLAKALLGDEARVPIDKVGRPTGKMVANIKRMIRVGFSSVDRKDELAQAIEVLRPEFADSPKLWKEIERIISTYYLSEGKRKKEVNFVRGMGQVLDVHLGLWYVSQERMLPTEQNVRSFTDELTTRLDNWVARLYWEMLKNRYLNVLEQVYPSTSMALAQ